MFNQPVCDFYFYFLFLYGKKKLKPWFVCFFITSDFSFRCGLCPVCILILPCVRAVCVLVIVPFLLSDQYDNPKPGCSHWPSPRRRSMYFDTLCSSSRCVSNCSLPPLRSPGPCRDNQPQAASGEPPRKQLRRELMPTPFCFQSPND